MNGNQHWGEAISRGKDAASFGRYHIAAQDFLCHALHVFLQRQASRPPPNSEERQHLPLDLVRPFLRDIMPAVDRAPIHVRAHVPPQHEHSLMPEQPLVRALLAPEHAERLRGLAPRVAVRGVVREVDTPRGGAAVVLGERVHAVGRGELREVRVDDVEGEDLGVDFREAAEEALEVGGGVPEDCHAALDERRSRGIGGVERWT